MVKVARRYTLQSALIVSLLSLFAAVLWTAQPPADAGQASNNDRGKASDRLPAQDLEAMGATPCVDGFAGPYPCKNIDLLSFLPLSQIGGGNGNSLWGWTDPLTDREYAIFGRTTGTSFVDITNPTSPVYLGNLPAHGASSLWRDMRVYNNHAFIVSEAFNHGMQVFDLTRLRNVPSPPKTFTEDAHYNQVSNTHTININEDTGFAYLVGTNTCGAGLHMVDISSPKSPQFAGCFSQDGYVHETQCVIYHGPDAVHDGDEICFAANEDTLTIVDVTNKSAPVMLARKPYSGSGYTHQGWLTDNHKTFVLNDELDEVFFGHKTKTRFFDVTDLEKPTVKKIFIGPTTAIDHNLYVKGPYVYSSSYRAGLRIITVRRPQEVAYFDIYPSDNQPQFNGNWNNYPFFDSGSVILSGIEQGLFVVRPTLT